MLRQSRFLLERGRVVGFGAARDPAILVAADLRGFKVQRGARSALSDGRDSREKPFRRERPQRSVGNAARSPRFPQMLFTI